MSERNEAADIDTTPGVDRGEKRTQRAESGLNEERTILRGVMADAYEVGTTARVADVILCRSEWAVNLWDVWTIDEVGEKEHSDSINACTFHSVRELEAYLTKPVGEFAD